MMDTVIVLLLVLLTATACAPAPKPSMEQLWVSYSEWPDQPKDEPWTTPGIVVAFCPGGDFRMASGLFYRGTTGAGLGASDGIAIFRGQWSGSLDHLNVTYWLESAEILPPDQNIVGKKRTMVARHAPGSKAIVLTYYRWFVEPSAIDIELTPAQSAPFVVSDRFVECGGEA